MKFSDDEFCTIEAGGKIFNNWNPNYTNSNHILFRFTWSRLHSWLTYHPEYDQKAKDVSGTLMPSKWKSFS